MRRKRLILGAAAAGLTASRSCSAASSATSSARPAVAAVVPAPAATAAPARRRRLAGGHHRRVAKLQATLRSSPTTSQSLDLLGLAYQQARARDRRPRLLHEVRAGAAAARSRSRRTTSLATSGLGSLALSRHRFGEALVLGRRARAISPTTARNYGVIGDALVELGRYRGRFHAFDTMAALRPSLSSYARVAHARELLGDVPGRDRGDEARGRRLARPGRGRGLDARAARQDLLVGRPLSRRRPRRTATRSASSPATRFALDALARAQAAKGDVPRRDRDRAGRPSNRIPLPQYVSMLGDLYRVTGQPAQARRQYALIGVIERLLVANGVKTDLETALFDVDHGIRLRSALALARLAQRSARRSTATTCSRGRSPATAAAARRSATRSTRSGSARTTRSSSSTAG